MKYGQLIFGFLFLIFTGLNAEWIEISENYDKEIFEFDSGDYSNIQVDFNLKGYEKKTIFHKDNDYLKITVPDENRKMEVGKPDLPVYSRLFMIPDEGEVFLQVEYGTVELIENVELFPVQDYDDKEIGSDQDLILDQSFYSGAVSFPEQLVEITAPAIMRDVRIVNVSVCPFRYDPASKNLEIYHDLSFTLQTGGRGGENPKISQRKPSRFFEPLYQSSIVNYLPAASRDLDFQHPSYLFIYPNDTSVQNTLQYLVDWKHQKGFKVNMVSTTITGTSLTAIKNYIQNAYNNWDDPPEFICLVADAGGDYSIPTYSLSYGGHGDQFYTLLEGNDILADVYIGRLSYNSVYQLQTLINKVLKYEKEPYMTSPEWLSKALLVGDPSSSGPTTISTCLEVKDCILDNNPAYTFDEIYSPSFASPMNTSLSSGVSYFVYRGYIGMSGWSPGSHTNGFKMYNAVILTCGTGNFSNSTSTSESIVRMGTPSVPQGGVSAIGTATSYTHTCFNNAVTMGIFHGIFREGIYNMGGALVRGKLNLYTNYPQPDVQDQVECFSYWNNLMGDPGMALWTGEPENLNVNHPATVGLGTNYLELSVLDDYSSHPVENAWVTILMGDDTIFSTGYTDGEGKVVLEVNAQTLGDVTVTVTSQNYIPYISTFEIVQEQITLQVDDYNIDDDNNGTSSGNSNGEINPGEAIELSVGIHNYGTLSATSVIGEITSDSDIIITDHQEIFGTVNAGATVYCTDDFDFTVPADALGGYEIRLDLIISDGASNSWDEFIYLTVKGPHLSYLSHTVVDGNDGMLIPGETADLRVTITNLGTVAAYQVFGNLSCSNPEINIPDSNAFFSTVNPGGQATCSTNDFSLEVGDQIIYGSQIPVELNLYNSQGYDHTITFFLQIGEVRITDPLGPDSYGYYIYDDGDAQYSLAPEYQWIEIDPYLGGGGTALNFSDSGAGTGAVETVSVPFNIRFYGQRYNQVSICSNGWLAPGETDINSAMNWSIPGPNGPSPMIAPFWDDLVMSSGHVCYQYRSDLHAFIVEWSNLKNESNTSYTETFQVIIYDPVHYPTPTGDSEIKIQYKEIHNIDAGIYPAPGMTHVYHGQYATVGIEDHTGLVGLEYTFNNNYPTAAKELENEMALFITTRFGTITGPPEAYLEISDLDFIMIQDDEDNGTIEISNTGENTLVYSVNSFYRQQDSVPSGRDSGGPDNYGYEWIDSNETGNLAYSWRDIQGTGTYVSFTDNDWGTGLMNIGFTFNFYGTDYTQFRINPNGWIGFGSDYSYWSNTSLPSTSAPHPAIMPFWDDLYPQIGSNGGGNVYYQSNADSLIVWFDDVRHYSDNSTYDFQAIMYRNGRILYQYRDMNGTINSATVGIQAPGAGDALQVVYNNNYIEDELAVLISPPQSWMELSNDSGTLDPGESDLIEVNVNSFDLEEGEYNCILTVNTNDPANLHINIPVQLTVVPFTLDPPASVWSTVSGSEYQLNWEAVTGATAYLIYSSADPYAPFASWHLEAEITQGTSWTNGFDSDIKFFKIIAIN